MIFFPYTNNMEAKRGRPPKPPGEVFVGRIELRMTAAERTAYEQAAERAGMTLSGWIRECLNKASKKPRKD